ncbi:hypothetical protein [Listeria costaricensis]|uniref:hypothetical protein n=1 Tax=Listeria costaricensis TaxID=2026604 RepID=UPI000C07DBBD|nr:hypothetical protein [Listeria costaricensis]
MLLSKELTEAVELLYLAKFWSQDGYEGNYLKAVQILKQQAEKGDAEALYFLARTNFGEQYVPHVTVGNKYENDSLGYQLLRQSFEQRSVFAIINGALRVSGGISKKAIEALVSEDPNAFTEAWQKIQQQAEEGFFFAEYVMANFYYWGDNFTFGEEELRHDLACSYYLKAADAGMELGAFAYNMLDIYIRSMDERGLVKWYDRLIEKGYTEKMIIGMMEPESQAWARMMISLYGWGERVNLKKAYKICQNECIEEWLPKFSSYGVFKRILYDYPEGIFEE